MSGPPSHPSEKTSDARSGSLSAGLYLVATPIGNLGDITLRALDTLAACDAIACEDTRVTGKLLKNFGLSKPLWRYDDHASPENRASLLDACGTQAVALVSDAGTPLISDPGYRLVSEARGQGVAVHAVPGPCAAIMALTVAGLPTDRFLFGGFLPAKDGARAAVLEELGTVRASLVFYETAPRLLRTLAAIDERWPERRCAVARELTKLHEECRTGTAEELAAHYVEHPPRGEIVLVLAPPAQQVTSHEDVEALLVEALKRLNPSQAAAQVGRMTGIDRKDLYSRALRMGRS